MWAVLTDTWLVYQMAKRSHRPSPPRAWETYSGTMQHKEVSKYNEICKIPAQFPNKQPLKEADLRCKHSVSLILHLL